MDLNFATDSPLLTLTGELWGVYCESFGENWLHFNGTTLYLIKFVMQKYQNDILIGTMIPRLDYVYNVNTYL